MHEFQGLTNPKFATGWVGDGMTSDEAAEMHGVSCSPVYEMAIQSELPGRRRLGRIMWPFGGTGRWLEGGAISIDSSATNQAQKSDVQFCERVEPTYSARHEA